MFVFEYIVEMRKIGVKVSRKEDINIIKEFILTVGFMRMAEVSDKQRMSAWSPMRRSRLMTY